jgi:hypothetical protein
VSLHSKFHLHPESGEIVVFHYTSSAFHESLHALFSSVRRNPGFHAEPRSEGEQRLGGWIDLEEPSKTVPGRLADQQTAAAAGRVAPLAREVTAAAFSSIVGHVAITLADDAGARTVAEAGADCYDNEYGRNRFAPARRQFLRPSSTILPSIHGVRIMIQRLPTALVLVSLGALISFGCSRPNAPDQAAQAKPADVVLVVPGMT